MKLLDASDRILNAGALAGITTGWGLMVSAFLMPELAVLALPAMLILLPSLLVGLR